MVKILHAADFHLDSPFQSLLPEMAAERRAEQRALIEKIAAIAGENNVHLVLLAGDLFDSSRAYYETSEFLWRVFSGMSARVFIAPGNHDYYSSRSPYAVMKLPENVHVFTSGAPEKVEIPELGAAVWGSAFTAVTSPPPIRCFSAEYSGINIGVFHGELTNSQSSYGAVSEEDIERSKLDYLALGHVHAFSGVKRAGNTYYAYPGTPEGRGFDETGEKGIILGSVGKGMCDLEFLPLGGRRYEVLRVKAGSAQEIEAQLPTDTKRDIYRLILTGESDGGIDTFALEEKLSGLFYFLQMRDETRMKRDLWDGAETNSLRGLFLRKMRKRFDEAETETEKNKVVLAVRYALAAMENGEEVQR